MEKELTHISLWRNKAQYLTLLLNSVELKIFNFFFLNADKVSNDLKWYIYFLSQIVCLSQIVYKKDKTYLFIVVKHANYTCR